MCSMTAQQHNNNSDTTVLSLSKQMPILMKQYKLLTKLLIEKPEKPGVKDIF